MEITYETLFELSSSISYTDHVMHFKRLFSLIEVDTFLEWGCGYSSKLFLDSSKNVISVELLNSVSEEAKYWLNHCIELFGQPKWNAFIETGTESIRNACSYQCSTHKDYALIDPTYVKDLDEYIKNILSKNKVNVSFVDAGVYIRGDLTELSLQNKIPIVVAHDTANLFPDYPILVERETNEGLYGWFKIKQHDDYEKIFMNYGCGTMFWIRKDLPEVIKGMQQYKIECQY
jgi:hypothetical protein